MQARKKALLCRRDRAAPLQVEYATAEIAEGLAVRKDNHAGSIGFMRTRAGWKIISM